MSEFPRPQDIGGQDHGPVNPDPDEPVFKDEWERRVFGLSFCTWIGSHVTLDRFRQFQAALPEDRYLASSYYERWLHAVEQVMLDNGVATEAELESFQATGDPAPPGRLKPAELGPVALAMVDDGAPRFIETDDPAAFKPGSKVRVLDVEPRIYDRLPTYLRTHEGIVDEHYGSFGSPEEYATGTPTPPGAHLYRVRFDAEELWGPDAEAAGDELCVDLFEHYLEAA
ncbi:MAG: nitrile hydratase subunit beta [Solirubrobacterales bacterium]